MDREKLPVGSTKRYFPVPLRSRAVSERQAENLRGLVLAREQFYALPAHENVATWERLAEVAIAAQQGYTTGSVELEQRVVEAKVDFELDALLASHKLSSMMAEHIQKGGGEINAN